MWKEGRAATLLGMALRGKGTRCSEVSSGRAVTLCLPISLHPKAAFSLFIPLQGNSLIIIKMSEGIHKYIHSLNEEMPEFAERRGDLWLLGCHLSSPAVW